MPPRPRISYIVSTYSRPEALRSVIASILAQTVKEIEIVVTEAWPEPAETITEDLLSSAMCRTAGLHSYSPALLYTPGQSWPVAANSVVMAGVATGDYLCFPSDDSYYPPAWTARMLSSPEPLRLCDCYMETLGSGVMHRINAAPELGYGIKGGFILRRDVFKPFFTGDQCAAVADALLLEDLVKSGVAWSKPDNLLWLQNS